MRKRAKFGASKLALTVVSILAVSSAEAQSPAGTSTAQPTSSFNAQGTFSGVPGTSPGDQPPVTYGIDAGVAETDNVRLTESNKVSQTIAVVDADFAIDEKSRLLDARARGDFSYLDYLQGAYGGQLLGRFDGTLRAAIIPGKLSWLVQDDFGQAALDPFQPTVPTNLENINYFATGPDLTLNLGPTTFFDLSARYSRAQYQKSPYDSNRVYAGVGLGEFLSARSSVSLNADVERVLFTDTEFNEDFAHTDVFGRYSLKGARMDFSLDIGATRVTDADGSTTGGLARLTLTRRLSSAATLSLSAEHQLTDAGNGFASLQSGATGVVGTAPAPTTSGSYTKNDISAGWSYVRGRTTLGVSGVYERDTYLADPEFDVSRGGGEFKVTRQLSRAFEAELLGRLFKTDYLHQSVVQVVGSPDYDDQLIAASLAWRYGRGLEIRLRAEHDARVTTGSDTGYKDNRAVLTIGYRPYRTQISMVDPSGY